MNVIVSLLLAGAALLPHSGEQPAQRITIGARVFFPAGKTPAATQQRITLGSGPATWYVFTGKTLCEGLTISSEKPSVAGSGWKIDVKPVSQNSVQIAWDRLWIGGKAGSGGGTKSVTAGSGSPAVLDSIDGGARLQRQAFIERLKSAPTDLASLRSIDALRDGTTDQLDNQLNRLESTRRSLVEVDHLGSMHPRVAEVDADIAATKKQLQNALAERVPAVLNIVQSTTPASAVDGCDALSMNLQVTAEPTFVSEPTETEVWLVHRDPAGAETVQRQVVRSANGNGSYVFDDMNVKTDRGAVTIEVSGTLIVRSAESWGSPDGLPHLTLEVNRRYVTTAPAFGWKTKEGGTQFNQSIRPDEVVAFNLLPLKDDDGALVGHRFSVRVRTKILK